MRFNKIIYLISTTISKDDIGNQIEADEKRMIYANEYSVNSVEFYNASAVGIRPSKSFEIYSFEYNGEEKIEFEQKNYSIIRTQGKGEKLILVCEKIIGGG